MEPITKSHKGTEYTITRKLHSKATRTDKLTIEFELKGSRYTNGTIISQGASESMEQKAIAGLEEWAQQIINDHSKK